MSRRNPRSTAEVNDDRPSVAPEPTNIRRLNPPAIERPEAVVPEEARQDRVIRRMLDSGTISADATLSAVPVWNAARADGAREPLWRFMARQDGVEAAAVMRTAADVYGFRPVRISLIGTLALAYHLHGEWAADALGRVASVGAVPAVADGEPAAPGAEERVMLVSADPAHPDVRALADELVTGPYELRYAPEADVEACITEISRHIPGAIPDTVRRIGSPRTLTALRRAA